jgi:hypothetical protein
MDAVLQVLSGLGSLWAQDPPYYATVEDFQTGLQMDSSDTVIENWQGWTHQRKVYFYHNGPIVVIDDAKGPPRSEAALIWHVVGAANFYGERYILRNGEHPAEMLLLPVGNGEIWSQTEPDLSGPTGTQIVYHSTQGQLSLATVFLTGDWVGAKAHIAQVDGKPMLMISQKEQTISLPMLIEGK